MQSLLWQLRRNISTGSSNFKIVACFQINGLQEGAAASAEHHPTSPGTLVSSKGNGGIWLTGLTSTSDSFPAKDRSKKPSSSFSYRVCLVLLSALVPI